MLKSDSTEDSAPSGCHCSCFTVLRHFPRMSSVHLSTFVHTKGNSLYFAQLPFHFFFNVKAKAWKLFCNNISRGFPGGPVVKNLFCQRRGQGDFQGRDSIPYLSFLWTQQAHCPPPLGCQPHPQSVLTFPHSYARSSCHVAHYSSCPTGVKCPLFECLQLFS